ncbi:MAG: hypothetical protein ACKO2D_07015 [Chloroflexota bacterium]
MRDAWRHLRASLGEYYYELPRMVAVSLVWFILCVPAIWVGFRAWVFLGPDEGLEVGIDSVPAVAFAVQATVFGLLSLVIAGPATAGLHAAVAPLAHGELFEIGRFVRGARHHFRRAWLLLTLDVLVGTVLALNVWFYWHTEVPGAWLLSILFGYALLAWAALQPYLFPLMIELDQGIWLVVRNAAFIAVDNVGLTIGLLIVNAVLVAVSLPLGAILVPFALPAVLANIHLRSVVTVIGRYRDQGRILPRAGGAEPAAPATPPSPALPVRDAADAMGVGGRPRRIRDRDDSGDAGA